MSDSGDQPTVRNEGSPTGETDPGDGGESGTRTDAGAPIDDGSGESGGAPDGSGDPPREDEEAVAAARAHLQDVEDGCGCAEVWEHLSDRRED